MENKPSLQRGEFPRPSEETQLTRIAYMVLKKEGRILLLKRRKTGNYSLPAGHIEAGETPESGVIRETMEEVGVSVNYGDVSLIHQVRHKEDLEGKSLVDFYFFEAKVWQGEPQVMEKDIHEDVFWASVDALPENMNPNLRQVLETHLIPTNRN